MRKLIRPRSLKAGRWNVMDLNSSNRTFLNHTKLTANEEYPLKQNDLLRLS
ncbi:MAG: FHA domain-containing protein, partial [Desulfosporosinus sp.]|nr:FHA domain-containing protein [Desulfosporosinus sp.]